MTIIRGDERSNRLRGGADGDVIYGLGGSDRLFGNGGVDILYGDNDFTGSSFGFGNDVLNGGDGGDFLIGGMGNDRLLGGAGDDLMVGGLAQVFVDDIAPPAIGFQGNHDGGDDSYDGGDGIDRAYLLLDRDADFVVDIRNPAASRDITSNGIAVADIVRVEELNFQGGAGDDMVYGGARDDQLLGRGGSDRLFGGDGADFLSGGAGDDVIDGGDGFDVVSYSDAIAGVVVDLRRLGQAQDTGGAGIDTLIDVEQVDGSHHSDRITGSGGRDFIAAGLYGNDLLLGRGGDDVLYLNHFGQQSVSRLSGGAGADTMTVNLGPVSSEHVTVIGGAGDDISQIVQSGDIDVSMGLGEDLVRITPGLGDVAIALGRGVDTIGFLTANGLVRTFDAARVTDFDTGEDGDRIDLRDLLDHAASGYTPGSNPFASGHAALVADAADTLVMFDRDGSAGPGEAGAVLRIEDAAPGDFTAFNFGGTDTLGQATAFVGLVSEAEYPLWPAFV